MGGQRAYTEDEVAMMAAELARGKQGPRNQAAFLFGVMTGCRASEICTVRMGDVLEMDGSFRAEVTIWRRHTKRRKTRVVLLCAELVGVLKNYLGGEVVHRDEYLFARSTGKPISRHTLYKLHRRAAMKLRLRGRVGGTHSMRKTFGEGVHDHLMGLSASGVKVDPLLGTKEAMGHSDVRSTEAYLQADSEQVTAAIGSVGRRFWGAKLANRDELEN